MKNKNTNATKASKATKATKQVEVTETVTGDEVEVTPSEASVLESREDITAVEPVVEVPTHVACKHAGHVGDELLEINSTNFSPLIKGGFSDICKPCRVQISRAWTDSKSEMRKVQARARQLTNQYGIPVAVPLAKGFDIDAPLMTIEHTIMPDGSLLVGNVEGGVFNPSRDAEEVFAEYKAIRDAERETRKTDREAKAQLEADQRKADRETRKAEREAKALADKALADADHQAKKDEKVANAAAQALIDAAEKKRIQDEKSAKRAADALVAKAEADKRKADRDAENLRKATEKAAEIANTTKAKREAALVASQEAGLEALKSSATAS